MSEPLLGDYDCEANVLILKGKKTGVNIQPTQYGADIRFTLGGVARAEDAEGQGGGAVISHQHAQLRDMTVELMPTDPANALLDQACADRERFELSIVDNSGTGKVKGVAWLREQAAYERGRVAGAITWTFRAWVKVADMSHGQTAIIG